MKHEDLKEGDYYWVLYSSEELFIAKYEGGYWMADIVTPVEEFYKNHSVIEEVKKPKGYEKWVN